MRGPRHGWNAGVSRMFVVLCTLCAIVHAAYPDDDRLTVPPANSVDAELIHRALSCDVRVIAMGDSFCAPIWARVFPAVLRVWPYGPTTAIAGGAARQSQLVQGIEYCEPIASVLGRNYQVLRDDPQPTYFGLPMRGMREVFGSPELRLGDAGEIIDIRLWDGMLEGAPGGRLTGDGVAVAFRMLHWMSGPDREIGHVAVEFGDAPEALVPLAHDGVSAGQVGASPADVIARFAVADDKPRAILREVDPLMGSGRYFHPAGGVFYRVDCQGDRVPGVYYSSVSDVSWSYAGFAADRACAALGEKVFSREQLAHWARATTLDPATPVVVFWYLAAEPIQRAGAEAVFDRMLTVASGALADAGAHGVTHCLVLPHFHTVGKLGTSDEARARFEAQRDAMFAVATRRADAAAVSIYDATEGVLFDGSDAARAWLDLHGYDAFEYAGRSVDLVHDVGGRLLDESDLHPAGDDAAALFANELIRELTREQR